MTPEHVEAARLTMEAVRIPANAFRNAERLLAEALEAARMLRTGLEREAVEVCEAAARQINDTATMPCRFCEAPITVGRRSLALKQPPKPRWGMRPSTIRDGEWVLQTADRDERIDFAGPHAKGRAEKVLATLNACDTEPTNA